MADGCSNKRRYLIHLTWILMAINIKIATCQQRCPPTTVILNAELFPKFASTSNYPHNYPPNEQCNWKILARPGYKIRFKVVNSFIEFPSSKCNGDYVEVFEGSKSLKKFCGSQEPEVISSKHILEVVFVSDSMVETKGMNFSYVSGLNFSKSYQTTSEAPPDKKTNKVAIIAGIGGAVLCSVIFFIVLCVCLSTKRCGCPCRNTAQTVEPFDNRQRSHQPISRTSSIFTHHMGRSVGSLPTEDDVISLQVLSPPPYSSGPPPSIDSPTNSSSPPPPYSFNDPNPGAGRTDSLPSYPGEVNRY